MTVYARNITALLLAIGPVAAFAKSPGPGTFCDTYPDSPLCATGPVPCTTCHDLETGPPVRNPFGLSVEAALLPGEPRPLADAEFATGLPAALAAVAAEDSDEDGVANEAEILEGTFPGDPGSRPVETDECISANPRWDVCSWDARHAYRNVLLDFCGLGPTADELEWFEALPSADQLATLDEALDVCMEGTFWRGRDGVVWQLANRKIRPVGSIPSFGYDFDYQFFAWTQLDDHDARSVLTADFYVLMDESVTPPVYNIVTEIPGQQLVETSRRAGLLTSRWNLAFNVMFTPLPRTAAAQAYRSFLGFDIARSQGLFPVTGEPIDYDAKGVTAPECSVCHSTLDPLTYPFRNYNGLTNPNSLRYVPNRLETLFADAAPNIGDTPEAGAIFGQPVADLLEWAEVAANSDAFARATVLDYWKLLVGRDPFPEEEIVVDQLGRDFRDVHAYSVRKMLHDLVRTEAYGAP